MASAPKQRPQNAEVRRQLTVINRRGSMLEAKVQKLLLRAISDHDQHSLVAGVSTKKCLAIHVPIFWKSD